MRRSIVLLIAFFIALTNCLQTCMDYNTNIANIAAQYASCSSVTTQYLSEITNWNYLYCLNAQPDKQHIKDLTFIERRSKNLFAFFLYDQQKDLLVLSFRATVCGASNANGKIDLNLDFKLYKEWGCRFGLCHVHSGFYNSYNLMKDEVRSNAKLLTKKYPTAQLMVTGVSLGGALAAIASYDIKMYLTSQGISPKFLFYTFGQPRIGNSYFINEINRQILIYRVVDSADPVPHLPPRKLPESGLLYYHPGIEVYYEDPDSLSFSLCAGDNDRCSMKRKGLFEVCNHLYYPLMSLRGNHCTVKNGNFQFRISERETIRENKRIIDFFLHQCKLACLSVDPMFCPYYRIPELHCEPVQQKRQLLQDLIYAVSTADEIHEMELFMLDKKSSAVHKVCKACQFLTSRYG